METFVPIGFLLVSVLSFGVIALYFILLSNKNKKKHLYSHSTKKQSQDFSAFESDPDKFRNDLETNSDENEDEESDYDEEEVEESIKGDMSKLEEFIDSLKTQPRETLSSIQISKDEESELLIAMEVDEEEGLFMEVYHPEEEITIPYPQWLTAMRKIIQELSLEAEEIEADDDMITITLEGKSTKEIKQIIERTLSEGYLKQLGNSFFVEYLP